MLSGRIICRAWPALLRRCYVRCLSRDRKALVMNPLSIDTYMVFGSERDELVNSGASEWLAPGLVLSNRPAHKVSSYRELLKKIAALNYHNSRFRLLFRGQTKDYTGPGPHSSLYPSILRPPGRSE